MAADQLGRKMSTRVEEMHLSYTMVISMLKENIVASVLPI
jgi:hypothetical protein